MFLPALTACDDKQSARENIHHYRGYHLAAAYNSFRVILGHSYRYTIQPGTL